VKVQAYETALRQYDKDLIDTDTHLPLASIFRPSNRLGESVFASADHWMKVCNAPNISGCNVEAYVKLKAKAADYLLDWASRHEDLVNKLSEFGRDWADDYPRLSDIVRESGDLHESAAQSLPACYVGDSRPLFKVAEGDDTLPVLRQFVEWWNKKQPSSAILGATKKVLLLLVAAALCIELPDDSNYIVVLIPPKNVL